MFDQLYQQLCALDGVARDRKYHPEGDALYHSLQVFDHAWRDTDDWELVAAALLHDVGKAVNSKEHDDVGADMLEGLVPHRVTWLVRHHLDLLRAPAATRRGYRGSRELADLERLRRWDLAGRCLHVWVPSPEDALGLLMNARASARLQQPEIHVIHEANSKPRKEIL